MPSLDDTLSVTRRVFESPKCDKCVWHSPDPLGEFQRSPRSPSRNRGRGTTSKEEGRGRTGKGRERDREGKGKGYGRRRGKGQEGVVRGRGLPPLYLTSGYGPDMVSRDLINDVLSSVCV